MLVPCDDSHQNLESMLAVSVSRCYCAFRLSPVFVDVLKLVSMAISFPGQSYSLWMLNNYILLQIASRCVCVFVVGVCVCLWSVCVYICGRCVCVFLVVCLLVVSNASMIDL